MTEHPSDLNSRLMRIFMPFAFKRKNELVKRRWKFVHYTSARNAAEILKTKTIWMRNTHCMNDFTEVEHGFEYLYNYFHEKKKKEGFFSALDACVPGVAEKAVELFNSWLPLIRANTYVSCLSEHLEDEDAHGRLSMWRAYGPNSVSAAIVLKPDFLELETEELQIFSSPVSYHSETAFTAEMDRIVKMILSESEFLRTIPKEHLTAVIFNMFLFAAICSKHPGFHEEKEWRIIHLPKQYPSDFIKCSVETIRDVPQTIYKIGLKNVPEKGITGIEIAELVDRIIIGPSNFPTPIHEAFVSLLRNAGVKDPESKVITSYIPLRT